MIKTLKSWITKRHAHKRWKGAHGHWVDPKTGVLNVFVEKKKPMSTLKRMASDPRIDFKSSDIIPKEARYGLQKIKTNVVEMKPFYVKLPSPSKKEIKAMAVQNVNKSKYRPLVGGMEISPKSLKWMGTLGFHGQRTVVKIRGINKEIYGVPDWLISMLGLQAKTKLYGVTNRHVVLDDYRKPQTGQEFVQPWGDAESVYRCVLVGGVLVDCALQDPLVDAKKDIVKIGRPKGARVAAVDVKVQKSGRTTSYTTGKCLMTGASMDINYETTTQTLPDLDVYTNMGNPGDSGSLICDMDGYALTLLNAGNGEQTLGIPIRKVLKELKIDL